MGWIAAGMIASAAVGAYSSNKQAQAQKDAAKKAAQAASSPTSQDSTATSTTVHGQPELQGAVRDTLGAAQDLYQQGKASPVQRRSVASGATPQVTDLANRITAQATNPASNGGVNAANAYIQNVLAPPRSTGTPAATVNDLPPNLQPLVKSGQLSLSQAAARAAQNRPDFAAKFGANGLGTAAPSAQDRESAALGANPVAQDLLQRLRGSNLDSGNEALQRFIAAGGGGTGMTGGPGANLFGEPSGGVAGGASSGGPADGPPLPYGYNTSAPAGSALGYSGGASEGYTAGPQIRDNSSDNSLFSTNAKAILGGKYMDPNDPVLKGYIDALNRQANEQLQQQLSQAAGKADAVGMYGGSGANLQAAFTRAQGLQGINDADAKALFTARQQGMDQIGQTLGLVNNRDIAGSADATQLSIAAQNRAAAAAASGASLQNAAADRALQLQLTTRGQNLTALGDYIQNNQFGINQLGGLASGLNSTQLAAAGLAPGLNAAQYTGLQDAFGAQAQVGQMRSAASAQNSAINFQNANAQQTNLDHYLAELGVIGNMEGTTTTNTSHGLAQGPQYSGGAGIDPTAAAIAGGLGAGLGAWGALSNTTGGGGNANYSPQGGVLAGYNGPVGGQPGAYGG
jgi:hypothetical protein